MTMKSWSRPVVGLFFLWAVAGGANAAGPAPSAATASAAASAAGENCEVLRDQIESRIAAAGVTRFSVTTVDAGAAVEAGRVVGTCGRGTRKIVYETQTTTAPPPPSSMLTECRDGSPAVNGNCRP